MKPSDIYAQTPIGVTRDLGALFESRCFHECGVDLYSIPDEANQRVQLKQHYCLSTGSDTSNTIWSVWFEDRPVMVFRTVGYGGEYHDRVITDRGAFWDMIRYIGTLPRADDEPNEDEHNADEDLPDLDTLCYTPIQRETVQGPTGPGPWTVYVQALSADTAKVLRPYLQVDEANSGDACLWGTITPENLREIAGLPELLEIFVRGC